LNPTDFAWATAQSLVQKTPRDLKVIVDKIEYPLLEKDSAGYVIHLAEPRRVRENLFSLHGMFFDNDSEGKTSLWRMYRASLYHLCMHAATTDYSIYSEIAGNYEPNVAMFAISMAEDYAVRGFARVLWPGLILDEAYANYVSSLRFRGLENEKDLSNILAADLLSYQMTGKPIRKLRVSNLDQDVESLHASLVNSSAEVARLSDVEKKVSCPQISTIKVSKATEVANIFEKNSLRLTTVHSLPYTESHGPNYLFNNSVIDIEHEMKVAALHDAMNELSLSLPGEKVRAAEAALENEATSIMSDWEYTMVGRQRLVDLFKEIDPGTHFEEFAFPSEDYAEFVRTRTKLIGPIRRVLDQLRMVKNTEDEITMKESGYVDIPIAIQVIASKSDRSDVFLQDEIEKKSESWAILIDSSKSLETLKGEARDIAVCLSEVAKDLIPDHNSWAIYSFDERMYILKDFTETYGNSAKARIGGMKNGVKTLLPDAIRAASLRLAKNPENLKVLLVASDGLPLGYDGIEKDLVNAIQKANHSGIDLIGLGVGSSLISKYFRSNCVIEGPYDLMNHFVKTYYELASG
jgi:hypothetical protein